MTKRTKNICFNLKIKHNIINMAIANYNAQRDFMRRMIRAYEIHTNMTNCSVHAWFKLFEKILGSQGFTEEVIMRGAAQLAFNDSRREEMMDKLIAEYELNGPVSK